MPVLFVFSACIRQMGVIAVRMCSFDRTLVLVRCEARMFSTIRGSTEIGGNRASVERKRARRQQHDGGAQSSHAIPQLIQS